MTKVRVGSGVSVRGGRPSNIKVSEEGDFRASVPEINFTGDVSVSNDPENNRVNVEVTGGGGGGSGDVTGPASSVDSEIVLYSGLTGKIIKNSSKVLTTVGGNILSLANPDAITFLRINADNTVTARSATDFLSDIGASRKTLFKSNVAQAITGTTNQTIIRSQLIPAGTLMATDNIFFQAIWSKAVTTGTITEAIYFNTSNSLSGATLIAQNGSATSDRYSNWVRTMVFRNSLASQYIFPNNAGLVMDYVRSTTAGTSLTINFAVDQYLIYAMQLTNSGDTVTNEMFSAEIIR